MLHYGGANKKAKKRPASTKKVKSLYQALTLTTTMGPGIKVARASAGDEIRE